MSIEAIAPGIAFSTKSGALFYDTSAMATGILPGSLMPKKEFTAVMPDEVLKTTPWANWGDNNLFPQEAANYIKTTHILNSIVEGKAKFTINKGVVPVLGKKNAAGDFEVESVLQDPEIQRWMDANRLFTQCYGWAKDYAGYRNGCGRIMLTADRTKIARIQRDDVTMMRKQRLNTMGKVEHIYLSREWPKIHTVADNRIRKVPHIDLSNGIEELNDIRDNTKLVEIAFTFSDPDWCNAYYSSPMWWAAIEWVKIAQGVPKMKAAMYENNMRPKFIVLIAAEFWDAVLFKDKDGRPLPASDTASRKTLRDAFYKQVEDCLTGGTNQYKTIFTDTFVDPANQQRVPYVDIKPIEDKSIDGELLKDSSTANSEISFANLFSPSILGAALPSGPYTNSQGGSSVREANMQQVLMHEPDRQHILDILNLVKYFNGWADKYPNMEFIIPATVPTTLDTGQQTRNVGSTQPAPAPQNN